MTLAQGCPNSGPVSDRLVKLCTRFYKLLSRFAGEHLTANKKQTRTRTPLPLAQGFIDLVAGVNSELTPTVYIFIQQTQLNEMGAILESKENAEHAARGSSKLAKRAKKEGQLVPGLIFQMEDFEKQLVRLSKAGKKI